MGKTVLGTVAVLGVTSALTSGALTVGTGVAAADELVGQTYADASGTIGGWGSTPVVSSVVGARADRDDCIVTNWQKDTHDTSRILLSLNCNAAVAAAGAPGNSAASPEGRAALQKAAELQWRSENPEWCAEAFANHPEWGQLEGCDYS